MPLAQPPRKDDARFDDWTQLLQKYVQNLPLSFAALGNYANDTVEASGGVKVGQLYRNGSVLMVRVS